MIYPSPWRSGAFCDSIALLRRLLRPLGTLEKRFIRTLVRIHNFRVRRYIQKQRIESVLLIMPRCLKKSDCTHDVRTSLVACIDCKQCPLGQIARLTARFGIKALVAYRSHLAYAMARDEKPDLILATACHDRLVKALCSVPEVPALLTPLYPRIHTCRDADFHVAWLAQQLEKHYLSPTSVDTDQTADVPGVAPQATPTPRTTQSVHPAQAGRATPDSVPAPICKDSETAAGSVDWS